MPPLVLMKTVLDFAKRQHNNHLNIFFIYLYRFLFPIINFQNISLISKTCPYVGICGKFDKRW
ncbi:MAG: hypothetical protein AUK31_08005 [Fibrobacteres bacterium CG2_30_45_31]|nr:MAG: hypothetical protein AUK31_08005 [Fibrobacteres bacterium CG2_30_45_31]